MVHNLTDRERRVVELWNENATQREIANDLGVTLGTVSGLAMRLKAKGVIQHKTREQVVAACLRVSEPKIEALAELTPVEIEGLPAPSAEALPPPPKPEAPVPTDEERAGVTLDRRGNHRCAWVLPHRHSSGVPLYCGDAVEHRGFCAHHAARAFYLPRDFKPKTDGQFKLRSILTAQFR